MRTVVSLHDMVKVKEESLEKKVKESDVIETSSDDDDFYMLFWSVCSQTGDNRSYKAMHATVFSWPV